MPLKNCPRCGSNFTCEADKDCWCESAQIHKKDMILIMDRYDDCLCPECLLKYSEE